MAAINWLRIRYELTKSGVAPKFIERTLKELKAHHTDLRNRALLNGDTELQAEQKATLALGDERMLVEEVLSKPELKSFVARFPRIIFLFGPTIIAIALLSVFAAVLVVLANTRSWFVEMSADATIFLWEKILLESLLLVNCYLIVPLLVFATIVFARQRLVPPLWPLIGVLVLAVLGSGWAYTLNWPTEITRGTLSINWGYSFFPRAIRGDHDLQNFLQILAALSVAAITWRQYRPFESLDAESPS